eukprot:2632539-Pyramimonas_sp.AAC.1
MRPPRALARWRARAFTLECACVTRTPHDDHAWPVASAASSPRPSRHPLPMLSVSRGLRGPRPPPCMRICLPRGANFAWYIWIAGDGSGGPLASRVAEVDWVPVRAPARAWERGS